MWGRAGAGKLSLSLFYHSGVFPSRRQRAGLPRGYLSPTQVGGAPGLSEPWALSGCNACPLAPKPDTGLQTDQEKSQKVAASHQEASIHHPLFCDFPTASRLPSGVSTLLLVPVTCKTQCWAWEIDRTLHRSVGSTDMKR